MRIAAALGALGLAVGMSGCSAESAPGDAPVEPVPATTVEKPRAAKPRAAKPNREPRCEQTEILTGTQQEGACRLGGARLVAVDGRSLLKLKTVNVAVRDVGVSERIPGRRGSIEARAGAFVIISLMIKNHDKVAHRVNWGQTVLGVENQNYEESARAELRVYPGALAFPSRRPIPPQGVRQGAVIFEVPTTELRRVESMGRLFVGNFGGRPLQALKRRGAEIGFIRLYK